MSEKIIVKGLLEANVLHENQLDLLLLGEVTFLRDFGPWKKGQFCDSIGINYIDQTITEYHADSGDTKVSIEFSLQE